MKRMLLGLLTGAMAGALGVTGCAKHAETSPAVAEVPAQSFTRAWAADLQLAKDPVDALHLTADYVFVYTRGHVSYVLSRSTGRLVTSHTVLPDARGQVLAPVVIGKDTVGYPANSTVELWDTAGRFVKSVVLGAPVRSTGAANGRTMYIGLDVAGAGRVRAVDIDKKIGTPTWELQTPGGITTAPIFYDQVVYFGTQDGRVYAISPGRSPVWTLAGGYFATGGAIVADLKADEYGLYVASLDTKLVCVGRTDGRVRWQYFAGVPLTAASSPTVTGESVYLTVPGRGLVCLAKTEGKYIREPRWVNAQATKFLAEDAKYAYVRLRNNALAALDRRTGDVAFTSSRSDIDFFASNSKDGIVYAATRDGRVLAIRPILKPGTVGEMVFDAVGEQPVMASVLPPTAGR